MAGPRDPTQFTRESAERIARVVRAAETAGPVAAPLQFNKSLPPQNVKHLRAATFTGAWLVSSSKVVTLANAPTATVNAQNLTFDLPFTAVQNCLVGKQGTSWYLVSAFEEPVKRGTFTAPWSKGQSKTVTTLDRGAVGAINDYVTISGTGTKKCSIARDGGAWHLIAAECS